MTSQEPGDSHPRGSPNDIVAANGKCRSVEPDMDFIQELLDGAESYRKCFQCGTCSGTCALSPDKSPFPRRQMAWAVWGMKDRLIRSPDIWLCYQCNDCTTRCPRDARPGDLLAAVRQQAVAHLQRAWPDAKRRSVAHDPPRPLEAVQALGRHATRTPRPAGGSR